VFNTNVYRNLMLTNESSVMLQVTLDLS